MNFSAIASRVTGEIASEVADFLGNGSGKAADSVIPIVVADYETNAEAVGAMLAPLRSVFIRQELTPLEAWTGGCCEEKNVYGVYPSYAKSKVNDRILLAREEADCWTYCCCKPGHSFFLRIHEGQNLAPDAKTLLTLERPGCVCWPCCCSPRPCLNCFTCCEWCANTMYVHEGDVIGEWTNDAETKVRPGSVKAPNVVSIIRQPPCGGGGLHPTLEVFQGSAIEESSEPVATIRGPTCFGGCSEICFSSGFDISRGRTKSMDFGRLVKRRGNCCTEMCTDFDQYELYFDEAATPEEKVALMNAALLTDYAWFEFDQGTCTCKCVDGRCEVWATCFVCYCCGCLWPCQMPIFCCGGGEHES